VISLTGGAAKSGIGLFGLADLVWPFRSEPFRSEPFRSGRFGLGTFWSHFCT